MAGRRGKAKAKEAKARKEDSSAKRGSKLPTPHEIRTAHKADLVKWCEEQGLDPEGKVDELRERLLALVEPEAEPAEAEEEAGETAEVEEGEVGAEATEAGKEEGAEEALEIPEKGEKLTVKEEEREEGYQPKLKAQLGPELRKLMELRAEASRRRPEFLRQEWYRYKRLGLTWRKPRGLDSKRRRRFKGRPPVVKIGYRGPAGARGLHPSGFQEVLVHRPEDLNGLDPKRQAARVAGSVGTRKRLEIEEKADELGVRLLNPLPEE